MLAAQGVRIRRWGAVGIVLATLAVGGWVVPTASGDAGETAGVSVDSAERLNRPGFAGGPNS